MTHREPLLPAADAVPEPCCRGAAATPAGPRRLAGPAIVLAAALMLAACGRSEAPAGPGGPGGSAPPPPAVGVVRVAPQTVALRDELPGRVEALRLAEVRARVDGVVQRRLFREGSQVKAGQALFSIDPAPYRAALDSARASLARAEANLAQAQATVERYRPLVAANAVSRQDFVNAEATQKAAAADVAAGRAAVRTARINLDYAGVTAPIAGRIGRAMVTEGALVSASAGTLLATIQQTDRVYVNFTQSGNEVLRLRKAVAANQVRSVGAEGALPVTVLLDDGSTLPGEGKLLFSDSTVDPTTGQITLRAEMPNPGGLLLPGQYVRVRIAQAELPNAMLVPQQAVTRAATGDTLLVVGPDNKPQQRTVRIAGNQDGRWIVTDGLQAGEQVIVDGFQKMFVPGAPVQPVPWQPGASAPAGGGASAPAGAASGAAASAPAAGASGAASAAR